MRLSLSPMLILPVLLLIFSIERSDSEPTQDKQALQAFFSKVPHASRVDWNSSDSVCNWVGVQCNPAKTHVHSLRLPAAGLVGPIPQNTIGRLSELRVLSIHNNRLTGNLPSDFSNLTFLRALYVGRNQFSGEFPASLTQLNRLTRLDLSSNNFSGSIPFSINNLTSLNGLFLENNNFSGQIPSINAKLIDFNVSNNNLNGSIPKSLSKFPEASFSGNLQLCGGPLQPCNSSFFPSPSPSPEAVVPSTPAEVGGKKKLSKGAIIGIAVAAAVAFLLLLLCLVFCCLRRRKSGSSKAAALKGPAAGVAGARAVGIGGGGGGAGEAGTSSSKDDLTSGTGPEGGERNRLVFVNGGAYSFDLEDLLRASAEVLGKGSVGTSYKAVLEEGTTVVVKRLKDVVAGKKEFETQMEALGKCKHENVVPLRAFYFSKDEKLLVYDCMAAGSLSALLHGENLSEMSNNASVPTSASNTPIAIDDDESPLETNSDPSLLPITSRHTSAVWSDFKRKRVGDVIKAECNHCSKLLAGGSKAGTTHLKDHIKICPKRVCQDLRQTRMFGTKKNLNDKNDTMTLAPYEFHQEDGRRDLAEMIILHEYPISMVEHIGFRKYSNTLQPGFKVPSRNTTRKDIMKRYELEKENVATLLRKAKGKIALTTDMWTADNQRKGYMAVTSHFIDNTWKLQSRIIRFLYVPAPHTAEVLADALKESIQSWNLDLRLSSITVDNCSTNDAMMEILKGVFPYGSLLLRGDFFHMRCCAHILNLIVQDGLSAVVSNGVQRIRDSVVFWTASDKRVQRFEQVAKQITPECSRKLALDCKTRWNSTYEMLSIATSYKEVFVVLSARNNLYKNPPTPEDWEKVEKICEHLEVFSKTTLSFSGTNYPTANLYFPKICALRIAISGWLLSPHDYVRKMADIMLQKYNKYWASVNGLMGVATILDPRYKMALIRFYFAKIFDEHDFEIEVRRISDLLRRLVDEYGSKMGKTQGSSNQQDFDLGSSSKSNEETFMQEFAEFLQQDKDSSHDISDLDKYLDAANVPLVQDFDILNWWKTNGGTYPILQQIARDILSIPVSTVASESAFSTSGRVLNPYRSRLLPEAVEALMCTQNWIWAASKNCGEFKDDEYAKLVGELEEGFETCDIDSGTSGLCTE